MPAARGPSRLAPRSAVSAARDPVPAAEGDDAVRHLALRFRVSTAFDTGNSTSDESGQARQPGHQEDERHVTHGIVILPMVEAQERRGGHACRTRPTYHSASESRRVAARRPALAKDVDAVFPGRQLRMPRRSTPWRSGRWAFSSPTGGRGLSGWRWRGWGR